MLNDMKPVSFVEAVLVPQRRAFPAVSMTALAADMTKPLPLPPVAVWRLFFYPDWPIGNFMHDEARALLTWLHAQCAEQGSVLLGVNLVRDKAVLHAAYNDVLGVPTVFNLNRLRHLNQLIGSDFDPAHWKHKPGLTQVRHWIDARLFRLVYGRRLSRITL